MPKARNACPLKLMPNSRLFHNRVRRVARQDFTVHREMPFGDWAEPDFVIALALANRATTVLYENTLHLRGEGAGHSAA